MSSAFEAYLRANGHSEHTVRAYTSDVNLFLKWAGDQPTEHVEIMVVRYLNEHRSRFSAATFRRKMASLKGWAKVMYDVTILTNYRSPQPDSGTAHPLPNGVDDVRAILEAAHRRHEPLIALCAFAGARISEALAVRRRDVYTDDQGDWWVRLYGKGSKVRTVPVVDEALFWLHISPEDADPERLIAGGLSDSAARKAIRQAGVRANISRPVASHDLRMTFGTATHNATKNLRTTQELLGHKSPVTTARYTGVTEANKKDATRRAFA